MKSDIFDINSFNGHSNFLLCKYIGSIISLKRKMYLNINDR